MKTRFQWRSRRLFVLALPVVLAAAVFLARRPILRAAGGFLTVSDPVEKADAVFLLLGSSGNREEKALDLYRQGYAPKIMFSRTRPTRLEAMGAGVEDSVAVRQFFLLSGVAPSHIEVVESQVTSTRDEAATLREYALRHKMTRVIVVTSPYHTRRARWVFSRQLRGTGVRVLMQPAPEERFGEADWWRDEDGLEAYVTEYMKLAYYVFNRRGVRAGHGGGHV